LFVLSTAEVIREQKRMVDRAARSLESERTKLKAQEKKLIMDMKKMAQENQLKSVKIMAKDLIRIRKHQEKFINLQAQLRAVSLQMQTMASTQALTDSMKSATKAMRMMNKQMKLPVLQKIMQEFARQSEQMEMGQEMMGDAIDDAMEDEEDVAESENVVNQVLDEIGIQMSEQLVNVPGKQRVAEPVQTEKAESAEVEARLNNLGR
jgi:charged multivesicular body protein 2A